MPGADFNLHVASQDASGILFAWQSSPDINSADDLWLDIATESGFVAYVLQQQIMPKILTSFLVPPLNPGVYYVRVNLHYPGFGTFPLDRGWFPSEHIQVIIPGAGQVATGSKAFSLNWNTVDRRLSWHRGTGQNPTKQAVDISTFPNFDDILASPFIQPTNNAVLVDTLPFAIDESPSADHVTINGLLPGQTFYVRVNTLYNNQTWVPSDVVRFNADGSVVYPSGPSYTTILLVGGAIALLVLMGKGEDNG